MLIKWIELENIRSYSNERIEFKPGTTLLSGDVGCGKSSVLLAAEFALFGIQRGEISGLDLLRHGKSDGSVKLCFEVADKEIIIYRALRRDKKGISQETGWINIDGKRCIKTASELRALVLELLGYSLEYQTKNPIVFRYTVYTPQDEMKRILFADADERLGILRKIFQIDKYGRIRTNADVLIKEFRSMRREAESLSSGLEQYVNEAREKREQLELLGIEFGRNQAASLAAGHELTNKSNELDSISGQIKILGKKAQLAAVKENTIQQKRRRVHDIMRELTVLEQRMENIAKSFGERPIALTLSEMELTNRKCELEKKRNELVSFQSLLINEILRYNGIVEKGVCSFCEQTVVDKVAFAQKIMGKEKLLAKVKSEIVEVVDELEQVARQQKELSEYSYKLKLYDSNERELNEKRAYAAKLAEERIENENDAIEIGKELAALQTDVGRLVELEAQERQAKNEVARIQTKKSDIEKILTRTESMIESTTRELGRLEKEINEKQRMREQVTKLISMISWLEQTFVPLMQTIEQSVMSTVQRAFNEVFQSWFNILMGAENLSVEVDDQFAPIIMQEGYQTEYNNLSGGEKTAVALAYRLALNKSINTLIENIRTKDLIILDEPTDGFSSEQIDRIRDVLRELNLQQTILVSHEPKIDTFVEHVIRFHKEGHVSRVVR